VGKKDLLAAVLFGKCGFIVNPLLRRVDGDEFYVLAYHRVFQEPKDIRYPFIEGTISASPEEFEKQIKFVSNEFNVTNFNNLHAVMKSGRKIPKKSLIITFDDGYKDNYEIAFGIIKSHHVTATIFVSTGFIDSGEHFWFDKVAYLINLTKAAKISLGDGKYKYYLSDENSKKRIKKEIARVFGICPDEERRNLLLELGQQSGVAVNQEDSKLAAPLGWNEIREMSDYGIEIGSHTVNHPFLTHMREEEMLFELKKSKENIEAKIGKEVKSVAYPFGIYNEKVMECAKKCGYQFGLSYEHKISKYNENNRYNIPRVHVEKYIKYDLFRGQILLPKIFI